MAILLVRIEDVNSLAFNEFFDYNGFCYASTGRRDRPDSDAIEMSDFYDATVNTERLSDIPVVLASVEGEEAHIAGWYRKAEIFRRMQNVSLFLEGNIRAYASDCVWLPEKEQTCTVDWFAKDRLYEVIEEEDARYSQLYHLIMDHKGGNQMLRYHTAAPHTLPQVLQNTAKCREACARWAELVSAEECKDIRDLKTLEVYAKKLCEKQPKDPDGYYYLALADYHLGFAKEGIKQINKALKMEPEDADLTAMKGLLLVSRGYAEDGAAHLQKAFEGSGYEVYLILEGRAYLMAGKADQAYDCFKQIGDEKLLAESGIRLKDMEKKWNSFRYGYMKLLDIFRKKKAPAD